MVVVDRLYARPATCHNRMRSDARPATSHNRMRSAMPATVRPRMGAVSRIIARMDICLKGTLNAPMDTAFLPMAAAILFSARRATSPRKASRVLRNTSPRPTAAVLLLSALLDTYPQ